MNRIIKQGIWVRMHGFFECVCGQAVYTFTRERVSRGLKISRQEELMHHSCICMRMFILYLDQVKNIKFASHD